jgi:hypothetical protein
MAHMADAMPSRTFRSSPSFVVVAAVAALLFAAGGLVSQRVGGFSWVTIAFLCLVPLGIAGVIDALTQRIELHEEHIVIVYNLRRREYPRSLFVKAHWSKGVPVSLQTTSGEWVHLPGVGSSSQGLVNTLRAWIRK